MENNLEESEILKTKLILLFSTSQEWADLSKQRVEYCTVAGNREIVKTKITVQWQEIERLTKLRLQYSGRK